MTAVGLDRLHRRQVDFLSKGESLKMSEARDAAIAATRDYEDEWEPITENDYIAGGPEVWTCTNCGKLTEDIIFEEGDSNICPECYDRFEENERRLRAGEELL